MAEENHGHHFVHHHDHKEEEGPIDHKMDEKHHKKLEHLGEAAVAAAGTFALHEKHEAKKDGEHAHRHKIEEEVAAAVAVGAGGFVFHEHHEKKEAHKEEKEEHHHRHHCQFATNLN
ncbi:hypothetical protein DM860_017016 [Cuscuta australis]|uniref:Uncharacterized protein n=2 Tax=cellular organisms TaxID=131567 RepID=A0A328DMT0_9ASTE|nr:hypothetical protein DM860_017016 [Cuscuta australis]